jgi:hypothetical protein
MLGYIKKLKLKSKEELKKTLKRKSFTAYIRQYGLFTNILYSYCFKYKKLYFIKKNSIRCGKCFYYNRSYNSILVRLFFARAIKEKKRLAKEEELIKEKILAN